MVDTVRTQAALLALLADNTSGDISPQDLRDFLVSQSVYGSLFVEDASANQVIGTTPELLTAFTNDGNANNVVPAHASDRLTIGTGGDGDYEVHVSVSFSGTGSTEFDFHVRKNGSLQAGAGSFKRKLGTGGDVGDVGCVGNVSLVAGDYLDLFVNADGSSKTITVSDADMFIKRAK